MGGGEREEQVAGESEGGKKGGREAPSLLASGKLVCQISTEQSLLRTLDTVRTPVPYAPPPGLGGGAHPLEHRGERGRISSDNNLRLETLSLQVPPDEREGGWEGGREREG